MAERIELTFLGTGSAVPTKRRNHPAMLLKYKDENILVDCGEGAQRQFRKAGKNPCKVTRVLITHWHGDHVFGLPGLLNTLALSGYSGELEIYGPKGTRGWVSKYYDLIGKRSFESLKLRVSEVGDGVVFEEGGYFVESRKVEHDCPAVAYVFVVREKLRVDKEKLARLKVSGAVVGKLARGEKVEVDGKVVDGSKLLYKEEERRVAFVMDTRDCGGAREIARDADLLVIESTYSAAESEELRTSRAHLSSIEAAEIGKDCGVKSLALVHLSQRYEGIPKVIRDEAKGVFGDGVLVPEDLDEVVL